MNITVKKGNGMLVLNDTPDMYKLEAWYETVLLLRAKKCFVYDQPITPHKLIGEVVDKLSLNGDERIAVFFTVEMAMYLERAGFCNITVITDKYDALVEKWCTKSIGCEYMTLEQVEEKDMKFDVIVGNPPYNGKAELHQKFFNKAVDLAVDGGKVAFVQPATVFFNKKENIRTNAQLMIQNVERYKSDVSIISGSVFENAGIFTDISVTVLTKENNVSNNIVKYTTLGKKDYNNVSVESINMTQMDLGIYNSVTAKIMGKIKTDGSIQDIVTTNATDDKLYIQKVRGHIGQTDFYTVISRNEKYHQLDNTNPYGLKVNGDTELQNLVSYLKTYIARFALSIYKFNGNNHMGELKSIPQVPLNESWNDEKLCAHFGISTEEFIEIKRCIPEYYTTNVEDIFDEQQEDADYNEDIEELEQ